MDKEELDDIEVSHAGGIKLGFLFFANLAGLIGLVWIQSGWEWIVSSYMVVFNVMFAVEVLYPTGEFSMKRQFIKINIGAFCGLYCFSKFEFGLELFDIEGFGLEGSTLLLIGCNIFGVAFVFGLWQTVKIGNYCFIQLPHLFSKDNPFQMLKSKILPFN